MPTLCWQTSPSANVFGAALESCKLPLRSVSLSLSCPSVRADIFPCKTLDCLQTTLFREAAVAQLVDDLRMQGVTEILKPDDTIHTIQSSSIEANDFGLEHEPGSVP